MQRFEYRAITPAGREISGALTARDAAHARAALDKKKLLVIQLVEALKSPTLDAAPKVAGRGVEKHKLSRKELGLFIRQLATLVSVMPLEEALSTLLDQNENPSSRAVIAGLKQQVVEGRRLSGALARAPRSFPPLFASMVSAGERSGALGDVLKTLAEFSDRQAEIRSKLIAALAYPAILAVVAIVIVIAMMTLVVPKLIEQFESIGQQLPVLTRAVMGVSGVLTSYGYVLAILVVLSGLGLTQALKNNAVRYRFDAALLRLPLIGPIFKRTAAARLARTLAVMIEHGMPVVDGLAAAAQTIRNVVIRDAYLGAMTAVREGSSISSALAKTRLCPPLLINMAASGENSGKLAELLDKAGESLEREFDTATATVLGLLEPAVIVVMGGIVTLIVLAILMPILQLNVLATG